MLSPTWPQRHESATSNRNVTRVDGGDCDRDGRAASVARAGGGGAAMNRREGGGYSEAEPEVLLDPVAEPLERLEGLMLMLALLR